MYEQQDTQYTTFIKCTKWQLEQTLEPINCPYHYYCTSTYPGDYPGAIDILVMFSFAALSIATFIITVLDIHNSENRTRLSQSKRYFLPSGPVSLPLILVIFSKGQRINTIFPLTTNGPPILHLILVSALGFNIRAESDIKYVFLEASTISGILHVALYLDSIILPYYTGLDALMMSSFSGECLSCICRKSPLVAGGRLVVYRGLSVTTAMVVGTLILRIFRRLSVENKGIIVIIGCIMEIFSWVLMIFECVYLGLMFEYDRTWMKVTRFCGIFVLILVHVVRRVFRLFRALYKSDHDDKVRL